MKITELLLSDYTLLSPQEMKDATAFQKKMYPILLEKVPGKTVAEQNKAIEQMKYEEVVKLCYGEEEYVPSER